MAVLQLKLEEIHGLGAMGLELGAWGRENGDWKTETGKRRLEIGFRSGTIQYNVVVKVL